jgi:AraC-like DNA-binding protein
MMRVSIMTELPSLLRELGHDPDRLLGELGLDPAQFDGPENTIAFRSVGAILAQCVTRTGCRHLGLLLGQRGGTHTLGAVGMLARSSPDVGSALRSLIDHMHQHDQGAVPNLSVSGNRAELGYAIYEKDVPAADQIYAAAIAIAFRIMRELCGSGWRPSEVLLPFSKPRDTVHFRQFFPPPLRFDAGQAALAFPAAWLGHAVASADHETRRRVAISLRGQQRTELANRSRRAVRAMLAQGQVSEEALACAFDMSRRTLVRHLQQEGTSYQAILKETQLEVACQLLRDTGKSVDRIAASLGYSGASPFTRAFKGWTGRTPADWRSRNDATRSGDVESSRDS